MSRAVIILIMLLPWLTGAQEGQSSTYELLYWAMDRETLHADLYRWQAGAESVLVAEGVAYGVRDTVLANGWLYFSALSRDGEQTDIYRIRVDGGQAEPVVVTPHWDYPLAATADGDWILVQSWEQDCMHTARLDHDTLRAEPLLDDCTIYLTLSPDGQQVLAVYPVRNRLWRYAIAAVDGRGEHPVAPAPPEEMAITDAGWLGDGTLWYVATSREGTWLYRTVSNTQSPERMTRLPSYLVPGSEGKTYLSPDGEWIAAKRSEGRVTLHVLPVEGGGSTPVEARGNIVLYAAWRPDSRALAFYSDDGLSVYDVLLAQATDIDPQSERREVVAAWLPIQEDRE